MRVAVFEIYMKQATVGGNAEGTFTSTISLDDNGLDREGAEVAGEWGPEELSLADPEPYDKVKADPGII